jgi:hypothetical protein
MRREITIPRRVLFLLFLVILLAAALLGLAGARPYLPAWVGGSGPDAAARALAEASLTVDYRGQPDWKARTYARCSTAGVAFWEENLRRGLWAAVERRQWITSQVTIADCTVLDQAEVGAAAAAVVRVRGVVESRTIARQEPFVQVQLLERRDGGWRFTALLTTGAAPPAAAPAGPLARLVALADWPLPTGTAGRWLGPGRPGGGWAPLPTPVVGRDAATWLGVAVGWTLPVPAAWPPGDEHVLVGPR